MALSSPLTLARVTGLHNMQFVIGFKIVGRQRMGQRR